MLLDLRGPQPVIASEAEDYLGDTAFSDLPILLLWKNATKYPGLQKMAMDYLAVPSSSVQSERENSKAKYILTDQ